MTDRKPIVIVSGLQQELPAGDNVADPVLAALAQITGYSGTVLEVEANTRALRGTLRPQSIGPDFARDLVVGHYSLAFMQSVTVSTVAIASSLLNAVNKSSCMIAVIRKVSVGLVTTALSGARTGVAKMSMRQFLPAIDNDSSVMYLNPPIGSSATAVPFNVGNPFNGLKTNQPLPQLTMCGLPGSVSIPGVGIGSKTLGEATGGLLVTVGAQSIPNSVIFDHLGNNHQPLTLGNNTGFFIQLDVPAAATSQTVQAMVGVQWTEYQLDTPL